MTSFWRNYVKMTSFWHYNDVIITSCVQWVLTDFNTLLWFSLCFSDVSLRSQMLTISSPRSICLILYLPCCLNWWDRTSSTLISMAWDWKSQPTPKCSYRILSSDQCFDGVAQTPKKVNMSYRDHWSWYEVSNVLLTYQSINNQLKWLGGIFSCISIDNCYVVVIVNKTSMCK